MTNAHRCRECQEHTLQMYLPFLVYDDRWGPPPILAVNHYATSGGFLIKGALLVISDVHVLPPLITVTTNGHQTEVRLKSW